MRNDSFGALKDGTLLWVFLQNANGLDKESYVIRSEDEGDGTALWPQWLGLTETEWKRKRETLESSGQPLKASAFTNTYVFRSTDKGCTWGDRPPLPDWSFETTILFLHSVRLIAAIRYQPLMQLDMPLSEFGKRVFLADPADNGRTWINFRLVRRIPDESTDLMLGEVHGELFQLSDGTLILTYDRRYPYEKQQVLARVSHDEDYIWTPEVYHLTLAGRSVSDSH